MQSGSDTADLLMSRALQARSSADLPLALQLFDTVVDLYPDWSAGWSERATTRFQSGDVDGAMGDLGADLEARTARHRRAGRAGRVMLDAGQPDEALRAYDRALALGAGLRAAQRGPRASADDGLEPRRLDRRRWRGADRVWSRPRLVFTLRCSRAVVEARYPAGRPARRRRSRAVCTWSRLRRAGPRARGRGAGSRRLRQLRRSACGARRASGRASASASSRSTGPATATAIGWPAGRRLRRAGRPLDPRSAGALRRSRGNRRRPFAGRACSASRWRSTRRDSRAASCCSRR